jgi:hypothetical protein
MAVGFSDTSGKAGERRRGAPKGHSLSLAGGIISS